MNDRTRKIMALSGLDILKEAVLLVLSILHFQIRFAIGYSFQVDCIVSQSWFREWSKKPMAVHFMCF